MLREHDEPIDKTLTQLSSATTPQVRFKVLQELAMYWHGPIGSQDGFSEAELKDVSLPDPLHRWYRWAGRRTEIMSGQNWFFSPHNPGPSLDLIMEDGYLLFQRENQAVYEWATLPEGEDPPVFGRYTEQSWEKEEVSLSEHLILNCLFEAIMCRATYSASAAWIEHERLSRILEHFSALASPAWRWPGLTRFYFGKGAFMYVASYPSEKETTRSVWLGAKEANALDFLRPYVDKTWDHVEL
jgi:hypothetical protein